MCYDKGKNGKESYNHGKMDKKLLGLAAIGSAAAGLVYYFKKSKKMRAKILTMTLKMKILILTMIFNRSTENTLI